MSTGGKPDGDRGEGGAEPPPQGGVLGNLPRTRPAVRSPRRAEARQRDEAEERPASAEAASTPGREAAGSRSTAGEGPGSELESLARGGIAIAGGAASLGLRIAGRAAAALRDAVERR
jgi:hypothetical protein